MWIHWSMTRFVRWRMKDWASCFTACRFPLDEETNTYDQSSSSASPPQLRIRNVVHDNKDDNKRKRSDKKSFRRNKLNNSKERKCTRINSSSSRKKNAEKNVASEVENAGYEKESSCWPHFADEDYIVFCFGDDGAFDVLKNKSEPSTPINGCRCSCDRRSSWPPHHKKQINYVEDSKPNKIRSHGERVSEEDNRDICPISEEQTITVEKAESVVDSLSTGNKETMSFESSDSNQSENSRPSFAFPILGREWMGSPAQMPRSEGLNSRKHKTRSLTFQCCRF